MELQDLLSRITEELCIKLITEFGIPKAIYLVSLGNTKLILFENKLEFVTLNSYGADSNVHLKIDASVYPSTSVDLFIQVLNNGISETSKFRQLSFEALKEKIEECTYS